MCEPCRQRSFGCASAKKILQRQSVERAMTACGVIIAGVDSVLWQTILGPLSRNPRTSCIQSQGLGGYIFLPAVYTD